jgi:putative Mg2+ transporter-C (MgtC) family protein
VHLGLTWTEIAIRVFCTLAAGALIGLNRSEHGRPAGLRTSMLVSLAACIAMLQVNLLLPLSGRSPDSFVMNDLMRLPLGILSGMGFIGAGAILRRDNFVVGVTTAATMWFLTVIGLCFGGGQVALGLVGTALALLIVAGVKLIEDRVKQDQEGKLLIVTNTSGLDEDEIRGILEEGGFRISACEFAEASGANLREFNCKLHWRAAPYDSKVPEVVRSLTTMTGVVRINWMPQTR